MLAILFVGPNRVWGMRCWHQPVAAKHPWHNIRIQAFYPVTRNQNSHYHATRCLGVPLVYGPRSARDRGGVYGLSK